MGTIKMYAREIRYKVDGPGTEVTATGYVASPARYSTISVEDLADHISADSRVERSKVAVITDSLIKQIREMVLNGHKIEIPHLGSFKPKIKGGMAVSIEDIDAAAFNARVKFTPSMELKRELQSARIVKTEIPSAPAAPTIEEVKNALEANIPSEAIAYMKKMNPDKEYEVSAGPVLGAIKMETISDGQEIYVTTAEVVLKEKGTPEGQGLVTVDKIVGTKDETNVYCSFNKDATLGAAVSNIRKGTYVLAGDVVEVMPTFYKVPQPFTTEG